MNSIKKHNEEPMHLFSFLPSNLISEIEQSHDYSSTNSHKESMVSHINNFIILNL